MEGNIHLDSYPPAVDVACCRYVELLVSAMRFMLLLLSLGSGGGGPSSCSSSSSLLSSGCTCRIKTTQVAGLAPVSCRHEMKM